MLTPSFSKTKEILKEVVLIFATMFIFISLSGPQWGKKLHPITRRGLDIIVAIDTSLSMNAEDIKPNRITGAKRELTNFIDALKGDRIGIIAFAGKPFLQCPLTLDYYAAKMFLDMINTDLIPYPGTAIADAIKLALRSFSTKEKKHKVLVVITDGEDHKGNVLEVAQEAKRQGVRIYTIGIGSSEGEPIPIYDEKGALKEYKKDKYGNTVMSKLDESTLQKVALLTGGKYFRFTDASSEINALYNDISRMEKKKLKSTLFTQYEDRFQYPLFFGIIILILEMFIYSRKKFKK